ncbi:MAG: hypothetical protein V4858_21090 [Pseudomonadota bacterium]
MVRMVAATVLEWSWLAKIEEFLTAIEASNPSDQMTQQNAALVEQSAATESLRDQSAQLAPELVLI